MNDIHARSAINKTAALVVGRGVDWVPDKIINTGDSELPLQTKPTPFGVSDLSGVRFARFLVIGLSADFPGKWVVRCSCGKFSMRRAKTIKNPLNTCDRCEHCRHLAYLKRFDFWKRTGIDRPLDQF